MLTSNKSNIFKCTYEQAKFVAECANLRYVHTTDLEDKKKEIASYYTGGIYDFWEDKQTSGGGCRICFSKGIVWITRHSGYDYADITEQVIDLFIELGCESLEDKWAKYNPFIYGDDSLMNKLNFKPTSNTKLYRDGD